MGGSKAPATSDAFRHRQRLARFLQRGEKLGVVARGFRLFLHDVAQIQKLDTYADLAASSTLTVATSFGSRS